MKITNWGICGTGFIANDFATKVDRSKFNILGVFDINANSLANFATKYDISNTYTDFAKMASNPDIQGIYIGTPNSTHYPLMMQALNAGKNVLVEKVATLNGQQLDQVQKLAHKKGLVVIEGVTMYYMPLFKRIKEMVIQNKLGKLSTVNITFGSSKEYDPTNRFFSLEKGGGVLFDIGTYALSTLVYFMGIETKLLNTKVIMSESGVDEKSSFIVENDNQVLGTATIAFRGKMPKQIIVSGDKGYVVIKDFPRAEEATVYWNNGESENIQTGDENQIFNYELTRLNVYSDNATGSEEDTRKLTSRVIHIMDDARKEWGLKFPHEELI
ncbi:Gfo/Idh/MocA family protein [Loigolactobacillus iwatensis]|uniref:Gfo/Idh/MocA family protein n=1 Tax=Loigolactobacillus iwatensis TaxID=1267156 RepID=UPI000F7E588E|nr:Gfo/Idh/MocA family oxidoreductase [Loigolactobacillus iwatensis]